MMNQIEPSLAPAELAILMGAGRILDVVTCGMGLLLARMPWNR
jgi:hypothetical protein